MSEAYRKAGLLYARISEAMSDAMIHQKNTEMARGYFASLKQEQQQFVGAATNYVNAKCNNVEAHHAKVLEHVIERLKQQSQGGR